MKTTKNLAKEVHKHEANIVNDNISLEFARCVAASEFLL